MDVGERFAVHFKGEDDFPREDFAEGDRGRKVERFVLFDHRIAGNELDFVAFRLQSAFGEDILDADRLVPSRRNSLFVPVLVMQEKMH